MKIRQFLEVLKTETHPTAEQLRKLQRPALAPLLCAAGAGGRSAEDRGSGLSFRAWAPWNQG